MHGIFPTQGWNPCLLYWQVDSLPLSYQGNPAYMYVYIYTHILYKCICVYIYTNTLYKCVFVYRYICKSNEKLIHTHIIRIW